MRLPRPCRLRVERVDILARQLGIGEALSANLSHRQIEAVGIVQRIIFRCPIVKPEYLLCNIAVKVIWLDSNISSTQTALQEAPEVLDSLSVDFAANIFFNMVDRGMDVVLGSKMIVNRSAIGENLRPTLDLVEDFIQQSFTLDVRNHLGADLMALSVQHAHDYSSSVLAIWPVNLETTRAMQLLRLWAYVGLAYLDSDSRTRARK